MNIKPRYFIQTKDDLFFAINGYTHPDEYIVAFLRYIPSEDGDRNYNGIKYTKVGSDEAYTYIKENHPNYLFDWNVENKKMMGVPRCDIKKILNPTEKLKQILEDKTDNPFNNKVQKLAETFHSKAGISYDDMGITGSALLGFQNEKSDIDFIIFGLENHKKARNLYGKLKNDPESILDPIDDNFWEFVYNKRIKDDTLSFEEFKFYEMRKNIRGVICGTLFDILSTMNDEDIKENVKPDCYYKQVGPMKIRCKIKENKQSYDSPSIYKISDIEYLDGVKYDIENVVSYTHTYAGEVLNNETAIVSGVCEEVIDKTTNEKSYNLVVGTTREALGEYIKLEKIPEIK
ncbi:MAG: DNA polymerase subunit beta [Methanosphaera sp.]|uniref:nucleotidyltransferase domain-containing protein n=1 Tax=Methanosphaera sp. TaxID=2666342 RepID=UPI0025D82A09|nr:MULTISPECIES: nucleotidyltransferase domain-containing protein [Methanobacteriaceae]MCI5866848.1 DNA polymerase subunit beta [Methanosphaera sp.]MDD6534355.1 DNA polymerase subunit beta [Methanosphaera sp.]MDY3955240.1 DNA polymerase subunit beta [Methanosphaera sp.]